MTFGPIVRALGMRADPADAAALRNEARAAAAQAGLSRLDQDHHGRLEVPGAALAGLRASLEGQLRRYQQAGAPDSATDGTAGVDGVDGTDRRDPASPAGPDQEAVLDTRRAVIDAEREEVLRWRDAGGLPDASLRILNRELDHEERTVTSREGLLTPDPSPRRGCDPRPPGPGRAGHTPAWSSPGPPATLIGGFISI